ncbi:methyltransferase domain-containing protein [Nitrospinaceae bacterium]|nr:methyltransferase domain-containing protein [Nitrospinaceae bacterium]
MFKQKSENNNSQEIGRNFSKYAHTYDKHAQLQKLMAKKLASFLPKDTPEQILEIGCGTGLFTKYLLAKPVKKIFINDISPEMITCLSLKISLPPYSQIIHGNAELLKFQKVDMIAANAVFQWFKNPRIVLGRLNSYIKANGSLIFSTFGPSTLSELRKIAPLESPVLLISKSEWCKWIEEAGFTVHLSAKESHKTFFPNTLSLLKSLQQIGAAPTQMTSPKILRQLIKDYDDICLTQQGVHANWELLYFSAINKQ